jgi:hypothetical protein
VVDSGPPGLAQTTFNIPQVSVTICQPGTSSCATIDHVLVDTGSTGLRIFASVLSAAGLNLPVLTDPSVPANTIAECVPFVDGYTWGPLASAKVQLAAESASSVSINIIDDDKSYPPAVPTGCASLGSNKSLNSPADFSANGVIGVGLFAQDCGSGCANCGLTPATPCTTRNDVYYSCNASANSCTLTSLALSTQVTNPVASFAADNNGVILQLPTISTSGAVSAQGTLTFGIGTQSNNALGPAFVLQADDRGYFTTTFNSTALNMSFIDSGSNAYFFASSIATCSNAAAFYCPNTPQNLSAVNQAHDMFGNPSGGMSTVSFEIDNLQSADSHFFALPAVGGTAATSTGPNALNNDFDFGLPFFYGRKVFIGIEALSGGLGGPTGPYYAY